MVVMMVIMILVCGRLEDECMFFFLVIFDEVERSSFFLLVMGLE